MRVKVKTVEETPIQREPNSVWLFKCDDPWQNLANAIVAVAAEDYLIALETYDLDMLIEVGSFFHSDWYGILTKVNHNYLVRKLNEEYEIRKAKKNAEVSSG